jgi:hypothetical protein
MSRTPNLRNVLWILVMGWAGSSGCIHNHYYGTVPGCPPTGQPMTTQVGSVCDVPSGNVVVSGASTSGTISSNVGPQPASAGANITSTPSDRVVISQPSYGTPPTGQTSSRLNLKKWVRPDPEAPPVLKAEGAYDENKIQ